MLSPEEQEKIKARLTEAARKKGYVTQEDTDRCNKTLREQPVHLGTLAWTHPEIAIEIVWLLHQTEDGVKLATPITMQEKAELKAMGVKWDDDEGFQDHSGDNSETIQGQPGDF